MDRRSKYIHLFRSARIFNGEELVEMELLFFIAARDYAVHIQDFDDLYSRPTSRKYLSSLIRQGLVGKKINRYSLTKKGNKFADEIIKKYDNA